MFCINSKYFCIIVCSSFLLIGCTAPELRLDQEAERLNFKRLIVQGSPFTHIAYLHKAQSLSDELHVYLDGDGTPWLNHGYISNNPTPRSPMLLRMMAQDTVASVYLGRPCYHGLNFHLHCNSKLWTNERYSLKVITSISIALKQLLTLQPTRKLVLIGYSGGGALAMLMAEHINELSSVVTIAGNLDIEAWTRLHHYSPLTGSINPAQRPPLNMKIYQLHLAGKKDQNVPLQIIQPTVKRQYAAKIMVMPEFDHHCCWQEAWPKLLKIIQANSK
jgi:hypothetical protein